MRTLIVAGLQRGSNVAACVQDRCCTPLGPPQVPPRCRGVSAGPAYDVSAPADPAAPQQQSAGFLAGPRPGGTHGPHRGFTCASCHSWATRQEEQRGFTCASCHARCWEDNGRRRGLGSCAWLLNGLYPGGIRGPYRGFTCASCHSWAAPLGRTSWLHVRESPHFL